MIKMGEFVLLKMQQPCGNAAKSFLCTIQDVKGVPLWRETLASISVDVCKRAKQNRSLFSASVSSHKPLFVLLGSFKRVVCNSVKN